MPLSIRYLVVISSFDHKALAAFQALREDYACAPLFGRWKPQALDIAQSFGGGYINLGRKLATTARLQAVNEAGLRALVYTVNDLTEARRLVAAGTWIRATGNTEVETAVARIC